MATIRTAEPQDTERLLEIYRYYVEQTAVSFEYETPSVPEFRQRIEGVLEKYPYLVVEEDGLVQGYAYAHTFIARAAYDHCCELTIYLDHAARRRGYGRLLYEELERRLKPMGIRNLYTCVGDPIEEDEYLTRDSERFHNRLGFTKVGTFTKSGYKFGRWYNMIWMEKLIGGHE